MISRLFKGRKRLDSEDPLERRAAVAALTDEEACSVQTTLADMAANDDDADVRRDAISRLTDPEQIEALLSDERSHALACNRLADLIEGGDVSGYEEHPDVIRARLARDPSTSLIETVKRLGDAELLLDAVLVIPRDFKETLLEHELFFRLPVLQELERRARNKDKRLNRVARLRLDDIRGQRTTAEQLIVRTSERLEILERLSESTSDPVSADEGKRRALIESVSGDLDQLGEVATALTAYGESIELLDSLVRRWDALDTAAVPIEAADKDIADAENVESPPAAALPPDDGTFDRLAESFRALETALGEDADFEQLAVRLQALTDEWLASADHRPPEPGQHAVFEQVSHRFHELADANNRLRSARLPALDETGAVEGESPLQAMETLTKNLVRARKTLKTIDWPDWAARPDLLTEFEHRLTAAAERQQAFDEEAASIEARVSEMLDVLARHVDAGELKQARSEASQIRNLLQTLPRARAHPLSRQLARISGRISELNDWQTFATTPKRESLCETIQELAENPLSPKDQAHRIKQLRAQWNELGPASRAEDHRLLDRFNEAANRAFEPCRVYFAEQAELRNENLQAREGICASLAAYLESTDWENADYRAAEQIMRTARQEWRRFHPVDRTPGKQVEVRFEELQSALHEHIKQQWDRNLEKKRQIVDQARSLSESTDDIRDRVEAAKNLQHQWKAVGVTPRRPDQALWKDFRDACDRIFEARDEARKSADESIQASQQQVRALIDEFKSELDVSSDLEATLRDYQHRFNDLPRLPERMQRPAEREFSELMKSGRTAVTAARQAHEQRRLAGLQELDRQVSELEQRHIAGETITFDAPDPAFADRWSQVEQPVPLEDLGRLTIEAEIAAGRESPEADRERRLAIQVDLMNTGRGREALEVDPNTLITRWCAIGPKDAGIDPLRDRFFSAVEKLAER